ncbi:hypothetical protein, partial [Pseudomonas viridiflava]|uniref:hypothetical protein n=1 Tax=Pseudomonas viridiflava TaxID=33069 RepID=UPI003C777081
MRISPAMLTCALTLLAGLAQAQQPAPAEAPTAMPAEQAAADATTMPVPSAPVAGSTRASTLRDLGIDYEITLRGVQG